MQFVQSEYVEFVLSRSWLAPLAWGAAPWLEQLAGRWLNEQQRTAAEFLLGGSLPGWTARWHTSVIAAGVAAALLVLPASSFTTVAAVFAIAVSLVAAVPVAGGTWAATSPSIISGKFCPLHGGYPLSYLTASIVMGKVNLVRLAAWTPIGFLLGAMVGWRDLGNPIQGLAISLRVLLLWVAAIPLLAMGHFSKRTNDTTNLRFAVLPVFMLCVIVFLLPIVAVLIFGLAAPMPRALAAPPALAVIALAGWALYGRYYERGRVDLLNERVR